MPVNNLCFRTLPALIAVRNIKLIETMSARNYAGLDLKIQLRRRIIVSEGTDEREIRFAFRTKRAY